MKVGVVGGSGFIGSHLIKLIADFDISEIDYILSTDIYHAEFYNFDVIICCAGLAHLNNNKINDFLPEYLNINYFGVCNLVRQCKNYNIKRFIYISSINVDYNIIGSRINIIDNNTISKWLCEKFISSELKNSSTEFVIINCPLVYGNGTKSNFSLLFNCIRKKIPLPFGSITHNKRSFLSIYNLVDFIENCIVSPMAANQKFPVSDDHDISTAAFAALIAKVQGVDYWMIPLPVWALKFLGTLTGKSHMISLLTDSLEVDISYTKQMLNWNPPFSIEDGLSKCIEKKNRGKK